MSRLDLAGGHFERREQRRGAMAFVVVAVARQRPTVRQLQVALIAFKRLDRRLFIDAENDSVLRWRHIKTDHIGSLRGEIWIGAFAPTLAPGQIDLLLAQRS